MTKLIPFLLFVLFFAQACQSPNDVLVEKSQVEFAIPLFHSEMSIAKMLKQSPDSTAVKVYNDNKISFIYEGDVFKTNPGIPTTLPETDIPIWDTLINFPLPFPSNLKVYKATIKNGVLHYHFTNVSTIGNVTVTFSVPQLLINGQPFTEQFILSSPNSVYEDSVSLVGYSLEVPEGMLTLKYAAKDASNNMIILPAGVGKSFFSVKGVVFNYLEAHWDKLINNLDNQKIEIDFFKHSKSNGEVYFDNPRVDLTIHNGIGIPVRTKVNYFNVIDLDGTVIPLSSQDLTDGIDFEYPKFTEVGQFKKTYYTFDKTNSNADQILNAKPVTVEYDIDAILNPENDPNGIGFMTDSSFLSMQARVELPLIGRVNHFLFDKVYEMDFGSTESEEATLRIITDNEVPLEVALQLYFLDDASNILDSLHEESSIIILGAASFPNGESVHTENEFSIEPEKWDRIKNTKKIKITSNFLTSQNGQQIVTFLASQKLNIKVGLKLKL